MKKAKIYMHDREAGVLTEDENGFSFRYLDQYLDSEGAEAISLTLPLRREEYRDKVLFPFFDGLIPEGWLLDVALRNSDISILDRMSLLLLCCKECIGSVSVVPINKEGGDHV